MSKHQSWSGDEAVLRVIRKVDTEAELQAVPSHARRDGGVVAVMANPSLLVWDDASVAVAAAGRVVVPTDISTTAAYIADPTTAPGRFLLIADGPAVLGSAALKLPVDYATTGNLSATRTGNVLTASGVGALSTDGGSPAEGMRILVWQQTTGADNGIYTVTEAGDGSTAWILTRAADFDSSAEVVDGSLVLVAKGTTLGKHLFQLGVGAAITLNTTTLTFYDLSALAGYGPMYFYYEIPAEAANAALAESALMGLEAIAGTITAVEVKVNASVTQSDTDYATITVRTRTSSGGSAASVAAATTQVTGGIALTAFQWVSLGTLSNTTKAAGSQITVQIAKAAAGKVIGTALVRVTVRPL